MTGGWKIPRFAWQHDGETTVRSDLFRGLCYATITSNLVLGRASAGLPIIAPQPQYRKDSLVTETGGTSLSLDGISRDKPTKRLDDRCIGFVTQLCYTIKHTVEQLASKRSPSPRKEIK